MSTPLLTQQLGERECPVWEPSCLSVCLLYGSVGEGKRKNLIECEMFAGDI